MNKRLVTLWFQIAFEMNSFSYQRIFIQFKVFSLFYK